MVAVVVVAVLLAVFWVLDYLELLPNRVARRLGSACGAILVAAMIFFPTAFATAIDHYARERARELTEWITSALQDMGPDTSETPPPDTPSTVP